jgi:hypothetical protein
MQARLSRTSRTGPHCSPTQDGVPRSDANSAPDCVLAPTGEPWAVCRAGRRVGWRRRRAQRGATDKAVNNAG